MTFAAADLLPRIGTEIRADKAALLDGRHGPALKALLRERGVLVLRGVDFDDREEIAFASSIGRLRDDFGHAVMKITFDKTENAKYADYFHANTLWHFDGSWDSVPPFASILSPRVLSPEGGQTEFANVYAAYDDLSDDDKALIAGLKAVHSQEQALRNAIPDPSAEQLASWRSFPRPHHPLVWTHGLGRKSLVLSSTISHIADMDLDEGRALVARLLAFATGPDYVYRHEWRMGDAVIWDNTGTMHRVVPFDPDCGRRLHRVTLLGEEPLAEAA